MAPTSASRVSAGSPAGASTGFHSSTSYWGTPTSAMVGTVGSDRARTGAVTASARSLPDWMWPRADATLAKNKGTWPPITSFMAGPPPR